MFAISYGLMWLLVGVHGVVIVVLIHQIADIRASAPTRTNALAAGTKAPQFVAIDVSSGAIVSSTTALSNAAVLCFLSTECGDCRQLASDLARYSFEELRGLAIYCHGSKKQAISMLGAVLPKVLVLTENESDVATTYRVTGFPVAVLLESGRIKKYEYPSRGRELIEYLSAAKTDRGVISSTNASNAPPAGITTSDLQ